MNDPGLDEPISNTAEIAKEKFDHNDSSDMDEQEEERNFLMPAKWWYASTAIPLAAGTFGPMANAFSICALVEHWRVEVPPGGTQEHGIDIPDPHWLVAVNAVSLVFALTANLALLLNMAQRLRFSIAQPITIVGFWIASVLLIALIAAANDKFQAPGVQVQALTQAYYYAIFSAGLYQLISYLMCITVYGAHKGHYSKEFKLTIAQRTVMLQTISFLVYLLLGALIYSHVESWQFLDSLYFFDFTCLTIGIGDSYTPQTHLGRSLLFPMAIGGIIILGLVVGSIRSLVLDRGREKMAARMTEKMRERVLKEMTRATEQDKSHAHVAGLDQQTTSILKLAPSDDRATELQRRRAEFEAMRKVQEMAAKERKWIALCISAFAAAFLWTIGALVFWRAEGSQDWNYFEALYFSYTSLLTIGYGDFEVQSNSGKAFFVFWSLLAIPTLTILISNMGDTVVKGIKDLTIWLGEITVLPSESHSPWDRIKYGIFKATLGKVDIKKYTKSELEDEEDEDFKSFQEANPGLATMNRRQDGDKNKSRRKKNASDIERMGADFEEAEKQDEDDAKNRGDFIAQDEHHYRHMLINEIRKLYADANSSQPKKYTYAEWAYYLKLLGEDETDKSFHRKPPVKPKKHDGSEATKISPSISQKKEFEEPGPLEGQKVDSEGGGHETHPRWSWLGSRSPLMADKEEPEWLLEKFFERLEEDLRRKWMESQKSKSLSKSKSMSETQDDNNNEERRNAVKQQGQRVEGAGRDRADVEGQRGKDNAARVAEEAKEGKHELARGGSQSSGTLGNDDEVQDVPR